MSSLMAEAPAEAHATRRFLRVVCCPGDAAAALLPSPPVTPLLVIAAGLVAIAIGTLLLRSYGPRVRVGRLLAVTPPVAVAPRGAGRLRGPALRADRRTPRRGRRVPRRERPPARLPAPAHRDAPPGRLADPRRAAPGRPVSGRDGLDEIDVDATALDVGLVTLARESVGTAAEVADQLPARLPPETPVRLRIEQLSSVEHAPCSACRPRGRWPRADDARDGPAARRLHARAGRGDARPRRRPARPPGRRGGRPCRGPGAAGRGFGWALGAGPSREPIGRQAGRSADGRAASWHGSPWPRGRVPALAPTRRRSPSRRRRAHQPRGARPRRRSALRGRRGGRDRARRGGSDPALRAADRDDLSARPGRASGRSPAERRAGRRRGDPGLSPIGRKCEVEPNSAEPHNPRLEQAGPAMTLARHPADATLSVTKAARLLGVHPNTIRAWSDQGRLRFYRINARGDRRYRLGDLQRFLAQAESRPEPARTGGATWAASRAASAPHPSAPTSWSSGRARCDHPAGRAEPLVRPDRRLAGRARHAGADATRHARSWRTCGGPARPGRRSGDLGDSRRGAAPRPRRPRPRGGARASRRPPRRAGRAGRRGGSAELAVRFAGPAGPGAARRPDRSPRRPSRRTGSAARASRAVAWRSPSRRGRARAVGRAPGGGRGRPGPPGTGPVRGRGRAPARGRRPRRTGCGQATRTQLHRAEALRRIATDIGSKLDLEADPRRRRGPRARPLRRRPRRRLPPPSRRRGRRGGRAAGCRRATSPRSGMPRSRRCPPRRRSPAPALRDPLSRRSTGAGGPVRGRPGGLRHDCAAPLLDDGDRCPG